MKKLFILLIALTTVSSIFAQQGENRRMEKRDNNTVYNDDRYNKKDDRYNRDNQYNKNDRRKGDSRYNNGRREAELRVREINQDYDKRISHIKNDWFMGRNKKERMIAVLENERRDAIRRAYGNSNGREYNGR